MIEKWSRAWSCAVRGRFHISDCSAWELVLRLLKHNGPICQSPSVQCLSRFMFVSAVWVEIPFTGWQLVGRWAPREDGAVGIVFALKTPGLAVIRVVHKPPSVPHLDRSVFRAYVGLLLCGFSNFLSARWSICLHLRICCLAYMWAVFF